MGEPPSFRMVMMSPAAAVNVNIPTMGAPVAVEEAADPVITAPLSVTATVPESLASIT